MEKVIGKVVQSGIAIGRIKVFSSGEKNDIQYDIEDSEQEIKRVLDAISKAQAELQELYDAAIQKAGEEAALIFEVHGMMLEDEDYLDNIKEIISSEKKNAEYAVKQTAASFSEMFATMDDEYMSARAADIIDVSDRLIRVLSGKSGSGVKLSESTIIVAKDLTPSETIQLDRSMIEAFVTTEGSVTSHTSILARTMNIPALIQSDAKNYEEFDGKEAIVDASAGILIVDPDNETLEHYEKLKKAHEKEKEVLSSFIGKETRTADGRKINLYANVGNLDDISFAKENDAEGIGLFRSEFLFLGRNDYPTEEEQFQTYKQAAELMGDKKIIIRTCDIGADKKVDYFKLDEEENPALGYRAIRICLDRVDFFKTQLKAIYRAALYGNISIMYPMIISVDEIRRIKGIVEEVKRELKEANVPYKEDIEQGVMIETPAAAIISDILAKEVDFFSIGTNDLTQYTLAVDRQNPKLEATLDTHHQALIRLIEMTAQNAHDNGIWVGICGELGADLDLTETFLKIGIDELSVSPGMLLKLREKISSISIK